MSDATVSYPFGPADVQTLAPAAAGTQAATITNQETIIDLGVLGANTTLNLTLGSLYAGAKLTVKAKSDGTARNVIPGTGMTGAAVAGTISKTKVAQYIFDGETFVACTTPIQID